MGTFINFLYEFIGVFIKGIVTIIKGIVTGFIMMFNFPEYLKVFNFYKRELRENYFNKIFVFTNKSQFFVVFFKFTFQNYESDSKK